MAHRDHPCTVEGCTKPGYSRIRGAGPYCSMHGQRAHRHGSATLVYDKYRNPKPPQGFVAGTCDCNRDFVKPRVRVKAIYRRAS